MESRETSEAKAAPVAPATDESAGNERAALVRYTANCLSTEEFVRFFHRFTGERTLVLPLHAGMVIGETVRFSLDLAKKETPLLAGLCRPLEIVPKVGRGGGGSQGIRVEVVQIEPLQQALFDRVLAARRAHGSRAESAYPAALERLARLLSPVVSPAPGDSITDLPSGEVLFADDPTEISEPATPPPSPAESARPNPHSTPRRATSPGFPPRLALPDGRTWSQELATVDGGESPGARGSATDNEITADHTALEKPTVDLPSPAWPNGLASLRSEPTPQKAPGQADRNPTPVLAIPTPAFENATPVMSMLTERDATPQPVEAIDRSDAGEAPSAPWLNSRLAQKVGLPKLIARLPRRAQGWVVRHGPIVTVGVLSFCLGLGVRGGAPAQPPSGPEPGAIAAVTKPADLEAKIETAAPPPVEAPAVPRVKPAEKPATPRPGPQGTATLHISTTPAGATLIINKKNRVGRTPHAIEVRRGGFVHVTAKKRGYHTVRKRLRVREAEMNLDLALKRRR